MGPTWRAVLHPGMLECVNTWQSLHTQSPGRWLGGRGIPWAEAPKEPWCPAFTGIELIFSWYLTHSPPIAKGLMVQKRSGTRQKLQPSQAREQSRQSSASAVQNCQGQSCCSWTISRSQRSRFCHSCFDNFLLLSPRLMKLQC